VFPAERRVDQKLESTNHAEGLSNGFFHVPVHTLSSDLYVLPVSETRAQALTLNGMALRLRSWTELLKEWVTIVELWLPW
jgi:hypothetical protein